MENEYIGELFFLPDEELEAARNSSPNTQRHLFIAGFVDFSLREVVLYRVDESEIVAPFALFRSNKKGPMPEFDKFSIIDHGQTIKLGDYEASSSSILYDLDAEYKKFCDTNRMIN